MNYILETQRLRLKEFTYDDTPFIIELLNSPGWIEYIGDRNVRTEEQAIAYLQNGPLKSYDKNGFGLSLVELKEDKVPIGMCGIIKRDDLDHPDLGFAFLPGYTSKGYAHEIASATLDHAKSSLGIKTILAITLPKNERSVRLLEKLGFIYSRMYISPVTNEELLLLTS
jgi:RimJ/RimL family protein N-acetyltransferase